MTGRYLVCALVSLAACSRSEEPLLTPPPHIAAPEAPPAPPAAAQPVAPAPTPPAPTPPAPAAPQPGAAQTIHAAHILVMYRGSMRAPESITRTQQEARTRAEQALARARRGDDFAALAREYSDDQSNAQRGGDLGSFPHGAMVGPFDQAAFALQPGQLSGIVETPFGYHIIKRIE